MTIEQLKQQQSEINKKWQMISAELQAETQRAQQAMRDLEVEYNKTQGVIEYLEKQQEND